MTVVLAHTPNASAEAAFRAALEQAVLRSEDLVVVNAARGDALVEGQRATGDDLDDLISRGRARGVVTTVEQPLDAEVHHAVLALAQEHHASVLVIGIRHRTAVGKLLMGSIAQRVLLEADCAVLAVKPSR